MPWAYAQFHYITEETKLGHKFEHFHLIGRDFRRWGQSSKPGEAFNAILARPSLESKMPLVVMLHDGPHEQFTSCFDLQVGTFLDLGMAVLLVNSRGSTGMGDASLESIIHNIGQVFLKIQDLTIFFNSRNKPFSFF